MSRRPMTAQDRGTHWTMVLCAMLAAIMAAGFALWWPNRENAAVAFVFVLIFAGFVFTYPGYTPWQDDD